MPVEMKRVNVIKARLGIQNGGPAHAFFTATCAKEMDPYVPYAGGTMAVTSTQKLHTHMADTVIENGKPTKNVKTDSITYTTPYARYQYYGKRKDGSHKIRKRDRSMHPLATSYWDKKMWTAKKTDIIKQVQKYVGGK